jgi:general secretion pathway protein M
MSLATLTTLGPFRRRWLSLLIYLIVLVGLIGGAVDALSSLLDSYAALDKNRAILDRLDRQTKRTTQRQGEPDGADNGPPFLIGKTITIAGAGLQERVESAVKKAGGSVLSSQIDLQGPRSAEGFVGLTESLEIGQAALQPLLYDLEAGMPYLFVENLAIQAPQAFGEAEGAPMRVLIAVSGQWRESQ